MLRIVLAPADSIIEEDLLALEFPTIRVSRALPAPGLTRVAVSIAEWRSPSFDPWAFDEALRGDPMAIQVVAAPGEELTADLIRILSRAQWSIDRRNLASLGPRFDPLLERYRLVHDESKPLARADLEHGLDTWQWVLRLRPQASLSLQAAALFHDVERATSECDARVEHLATDVEAWERTHAEAGARLAMPLLADVLDDPLALQRACDLIRSHAAPEDPDAQVLADADALSFLQRGALLSVMHHGEGHATRKLADALARLSRQGREKLATLRLDRRPVEAEARV